jgi:hypothetical protein
MTRRVHLGALVAIVFGAAVTVGWAASTWLGPLLAGQSSSTATRPTPQPYAPLTLQVIVAGASSEVTITTDGECSVLRASQPLFDACSLAVNSDPAVIGGAALGRLNSQHTPSYDALVWRARAEGNPDVCAAGGLEGSWLAKCQADVARADYSLSHAGLIVRVVKAP